MVAGILYIISCYPVMVDAQIKKGGAGSMTTLDRLQTQLRNFILSDQVFEAETTLKKIGKDAVPVLRELIKSEKVRVRSNVLELAGQLGDIESCSLILRALDDPDDEVRNLAIFQINKCSHRELIPDMFIALERHSDPRTRGTLSLQLGMIGNKDQIPLLKKYLGKAKDPELRHQIGLALTRLGDLEARAALIQRLSDGDSSVRYRALQDCLYIQDKSLAAYFTLALEDFRNVVQLTIPGEKPAVYARICDIAVTVMEGLGYKFSFTAETVQIRSGKELEEAKKIVSSIPRQ